MSTVHTRRRNAAGAGRRQSLVEESNETANPRDRSGLKFSVDWNRFTILATLLLVLLMGQSSLSNNHDPSEKEGSVGQIKLDQNRSLELQQQQNIAMTPRTCSINHFDITSPDAVGAGSTNPVLLRGWKRPKKWTEGEFLDRMGHYQQYVKNGLVQPLKDPHGNRCRLPGSEISKLMKRRQDADLLFFTNNKENEFFMKDLDGDYEVPEALQHIAGFQVFSGVPKGRSHTFHRHGESWLGQVEGRRVWWFLPPSAEKPLRVNACDYMTGAAIPPLGAVSCVQEPGDIIWFPKDWYHATCALDSWTVGIGAQMGPLIGQQFEPLDHTKVMTETEIKETIDSCLGPEVDPEVSDTRATDWNWYGGDLNAYYNDLEKDHNRNPERIASYAVHRWIGENRSTEEHYNLLHAAISKYHQRPDSALRVFDGGCGLGSGLMWMELNHPEWKLTGYTVSEEQYKFIVRKLPQHNFQVSLRSYNDLDTNYDFIYSIEALVHSPNVTETLQEWAIHLNDGGVIAIIDDFLAIGTSREDEEVISFAKSWLANSLFTADDLDNIGRNFGLHVVELRDLSEEYRINELNYKNTMPDLNPNTGRTHQGWMGSKWRQRLTLEGKLKYNMMVFQKAGNGSRNRSVATASFTDEDCSVVPSKSSDSLGASFAEITPHLMSGNDRHGGWKIECISRWYCCNKGFEWYDSLERNRTNDTSYLKLPRDLFGHYISSFAKHLNKHYNSYPENPIGRFLDIGGTGSTTSGMKQVISKFQHFAGPLEYWILDSDPGAKELERTIYCDIDDCPGAETCGFDVTFSHTVLEHAKRPWKSFDTIARVTKKGGLTMHLVPFSYQYHATPDDNYRFSHTALISLLEDRGFDVLEVGYDICQKQPKMLRNVDEHFDTIWLTYIIGRKR